MYIRDLKKLKKDIEEKELFIEQLKQELNQMKTDFQYNCHHPEQYILTDEKYYSGDYYNTSYTEYTPRCALCNKKGKTTFIDHGCYS